MPVAAKKNPAASAPKPGRNGKAAKKPDAPATSTRPILYPTLSVCGIAIPEENTRINYQLAGDILGWEDENEYRARVGADSPEGLVGYGEDFLLLDEYGVKVQCWNNGRNRPLDEGHCNKIGQDVLEREFKLNGETIIVGRTGLSLSAQHRLIGYRRAVQRWRKNPAAYPKWAEEPYINALVVFGISEDADVVKTLDNVRPRTDSDVIYTSGIFDTVTVPGESAGDPYVTRASTKAEKKECSRMYAAATAFLWQRTRAGGEGEDKTFQTHSASDDFRARHPKLLDAVKYVFEQNMDRALSRLRLSPGMCAGALYLMAAGESDAKKYNAAPDEKKLKFSRWDKAAEFWADIAKSADAQPVRNAIAALVDADDLTGGRATEKFAVLAKAWETFLASGTVTDADLAMDDCWETDGDGMRRLVDCPTFGGIDRGPALRAKTEEGGDDPAEQAKTKEQIRAEHAEEMKARVGRGNARQAEPSAPPVSLVDQLMDLRRAHPGKLLLFEGKDRYTAYGSDAKTLAKERKLLIKHKHGMPAAELGVDSFEDACAALAALGEKVAVVEPTPNGNVKAVRDVAPPKKKGGK